MSRGEGSGGEEEKNKACNFEPHKICCGKDLNFFNLLSTYHRFS